MCSYVCEGACRVIVKRRREASLAELDQQEAAAAARCGACALRRSQVDEEDDSCLMYQLTARSQNGRLSFLFDD